jgi:hypothetical protein
MEMELYKIVRTMADGTEKDMGNISGMMASQAIMDMEDLDDEYGVTASYRLAGLRYRVKG